MRIRVIVLLVFFQILFQTHHFAQSTKLEWENPDINSINKEKPRADFYHYQDEISALLFDRSKSVNFRSLNGEWKFLYLDNMGDVPPNFYEPAFIDNGWEKISVPSNWQLKGHGLPRYTGNKYPFTSKPPAVPKNKNEIGCYRTKFSIPYTWNEKEIFLHFDGVESCFYIWINGQKVGYSENSFGPAEFNITKYLKPNDNQITVEVLRYCDGSLLENHDFWKMSGIYRDVYLFATPKFYIRDFTVRTDLDSFYKDATLKVDVKLTYAVPKKPKEYLLMYQLLDLNNKVIAAETVTTSKKALPNHEQIINIEKKITNPLKWSAEQPNLYKLVILLRDIENVKLEAVSCKIGFRKVEVKKEYLLLNGVPIKIKGVNLQEFDPENGRSMPLELIEKDLTLMKLNNINAFRTCNYPHTPFVYDKCDEYGIYIFDEPNIEINSSIFNPVNDPVWKKAYLERGMSMVERDKNHPSVIVWSMGNGSDYGNNLMEMASAIDKFDPGRPIQYNGNNQLADQNIPKQPFDIVAKKFLRPDELFTLEKNNPNSPLILSEYMYSMGNTGGLKLYWDVFNNGKRFQGGFISDWVDMGFRQKSKDGKDYFAYGGDFGDSPNDSIFCIRGLVYPDRRIKPALAEVQKACQSVSFDTTELKNFKLYITNNHDFTNLLYYDNKWEIFCEGEVKTVGKFDKPDFSPGKKDFRNIPQLFEEIKPAQEYFLNAYFYLNENTVWAKKGQLLYWDQFRLNVRIPSKPTIDISTFAEISKQENDSLVTFDTRKYKIVFHKKKGDWISYSTNNREFIQAPIHANFFRNLTIQEKLLKNKVGEKSDIQFDHLVEKSTGFSITKIKNNVYLVESKKEYQTTGIQKVADVIYKYFIFGDGEIELETSIIPEKSIGPLPKAGLQVALAEGFYFAYWNGLGPSETYPDRKYGGKVNIFNKIVDDLQEKYIVPQLNGNRSDVKWVAFNSTDNRGIFFEADQLINFSAFHYSDVALNQAKHTYDIINQKFTIINLDYALPGLGTPLTGLTYKDEYIVKPHEMKFRIRIKPFNGAEQQVLEFSRSTLPRF